MNGRMTKRWRVTVYAGPAGSVRASVRRRGFRLDVQLRQGAHAFVRGEPGVRLLGQVPTAGYGPPVHGKAPSVLSLQLAPRVSDRAPRVSPL